MEKKRRKASVGKGLWDMEWKLKNHSFYDKNTLLCHKNVQKII